MSLITYQSNIAKAQPTHPGREGFEKNEATVSLLTSGGDLEGA